MRTDFNFNRVLAFLKVAELGSFSAAAKVLGISIGMVSVHIRELERTLGVSLLVRTTRALSLTDVGQKFYERFSDISQQIEVFLDHLSAISKECSGVLRIVSPHEFGSKFIAPLIFEFSVLNPKLEIIYDAGRSNEAHVAGQYDLTVFVGEPLSSSKKGRKIYEFEMYLAASPNLVEGADLKDVSILNALPWVVNNEKLTNDGWILRSDCVSNFEVKPSVKYQSNALSIVRQMVVSGLGVSCLPAWMVQKDINNKKLVRLFRDYQIPSVSVYVLYPNAVKIPVRARKFIDGGRWSRVQHGY